MLALDLLLLLEWALANESLNFYLNRVIITEMKINSKVPTIKGIFELSMFFYYYYSAFSRFLHFHVFIWECRKCPFSYFPDYHFYVFYVFIYLGFLCCFACNSIHFYAFSCYYYICSCILGNFNFICTERYEWKRMKIDEN